MYPADLDPETIAWYHLIDFSVSIIGYVLM